MAKPMHDTERLSYAGAVDADGHVLEPPDLWERYIDPQYRDRPCASCATSGTWRSSRSAASAAGWSRRGFPSTLGAMGAPDMADIRRNPERTYLGEAPFGSMDPAERLAVLDAEGLDAVVLYTTIGLLWEAELDEPELCQAYTRAYNRWICEFCADSPRLVPTAHLSLTDPAAAAAELERAVGEGARWPTWPRSPPAASRWGIPTTTRSSPRPRTWTCPSPSTRRSSRHGPRAALRRPARP